MSNLRIEPQTFEMFPALRLGVLRCSHLRNTGIEAMREHLLYGSQEKVRRTLDKDTLLDHPAIKAWRGAYKVMNTPKGTRCSAENLVRRVLNGNAVPMINPLVDLYNAVSMEHVIPCGGSDLAKVSGDVWLGAAKGNEVFIPLGETENQPPAPGEFVYADEAGILCRCLNWREAERSSLRESTTDAFLIMEVLEPRSYIALENAMHMLKKLIETLLGGRVEPVVLSLEQSECTFL